MSLLTIFILFFRFKLMQVFCSDSVFVLFRLVTFQFHPETKRFASLICLYNELIYV